MYCDMGLCPRCKNVPLRLNRDDFFSCPCGIQLINGGGIAIIRNVRQSSDFCERVIYAETFLDGCLLMTESDSEDCAPGHCIRDEEELKDYLSEIK